jgi:hypothetical protein
VQLSFFWQDTAQGSPAFARAAVWQVPVVVETFTSPVQTHSVTRPVIRHSPWALVQGIPPTPHGAPSGLVPTNTPWHAASSGWNAQVLAVAL